jgi:hypothetical protein
VKFKSVYQAAEGGHGGPPSDDVDEPSSCPPALRMIVICSSRPSSASMTADPAPSIGPEAGRRGIALDQQRLRNR